MFTDRRIKYADVLTIDLPGEAFYDPSIDAGKPEWRGTRVYLRQTNEAIEKEGIIWFSGLASQEGTSNDLISLFNSFGALNVPPFGNLAYDQMSSNFGIPAAAVEYPSINTIPFTITLVDRSGKVVIDGLPYCWNLNRIIYANLQASGRKGWYNMWYDLPNIDLYNSYVTITSDGLPLQISGVDPVEFQPVYRGPYQLYFAILS